MQRLIEPELLDQLPSTDPAAIRSREELRLINGIMGNHRWIVRRLKALIKPGWRVLELGAGDGGLCGALIDSGVCGAKQITAVDLAPRPDALHPDVAWLRQSIFEMAQLPPAEIVIANLFLHHFDADQLTALGSRLSASARIVLACEPARKRFHLAQGTLLAALADFNDVTNHDMLTSIRAGFLGDELPRSLGMQEWRCLVSCTVLGAYHMEAVRPDPY
jgi:2-polyprenyl-3-methyl-5-hydroxy-6-metoxy-1,4-benzoquinol methylase